MARRPFPRGVSKKNGKAFDFVLNSDDPDLDFSGSFVAFVGRSAADGDPDAGGGVFLQGPDLGITRVSTDANGDPIISEEFSSPSVSQSGDFVAFATDADLTFTSGPGGGQAEDSNDSSDVYVKTLTGPAAGQLVLASARAEDGTPGGGVPTEIPDPGLSVPSVVDMSPNARFVAFVSENKLTDDDDDDAADVYVRDLQQPPGSGQTLATVNVEGVAETASISNNGNFIAFATRVVDESLITHRVYLWDRNDPTNPTLIDQWETTSSDKTFPVISGNGRFVAYDMQTDVDGNGFADTEQVFRWDRLADPAADPIDISPLLTPEVDPSGPSISSTGRFVAFRSIDALVQDDTNEDWDIYVRDVNSGELTRANVDEFGDEAQPNVIVSAGLDSVGSTAPALSGNGKIAAFVTESPSLLSFGRFPGQFSDDGFVFDIGAGDPLALGDTVLRTTVIFEDLNERVGTDGPDNIRGRAGADLIDGLRGGDVISDPSGEDRLLGSEGNDRIHANRQSDFVSGGPGNDSLFGGAGPDRIRGGEGNDRVRGDQGGDRLDGGPGDDVLSGGRGNDDLEGGSGDDTIMGGPGADHFVYDRFGSSVALPDADGAGLGCTLDLDGCNETIGHDRILDFTKGQDKIVLRNFDFRLVELVDSDENVLFSGPFEFADLEIHVSGQDMVIDLSAAFQHQSGTDMITVVGVTRLDASDFIFQ